MRLHIGAEHFKYGGGGRANLQVTNLGWFPQKFIELLRGPGPSNVIIGGGGGAGIPFPLPAFTPYVTGVV